MATPFSVVYDRFLQKISDYSFSNLTQTELEDQLEGYLKSAIPKFKRCKKDLSDRDDVTKQFNQDLTEEEIEILSHLMIDEYLSPMIITSEILKQTLGDKNFKLYSQANHLKELIGLRNEVRKYINKLLLDYTYYNGSLDDFK